MNLFELGLILKEARIRRALTQSDLASRTGVSLSTISGLERGSLSEIGTVKLLQLFAAVGLELQPRPVGQRRTLDDVVTANAQTSYARGTVSATGKKNADESLGAAKMAKVRPSVALEDYGQARQRVRHAPKAEKKK